MVASADLKLKHFLGLLLPGLLLDFDHIWSKNVAFDPKGVFSQKKTAGGHAPGLKQRLYLPEMPTLMHIVFKYQPIIIPILLY